MIKGKKNIGGLVGHNKGKIENCYVSKDIKVIGEENVGALVGKNEGEIIDSGISNNFKQLKNSGSTKTNSIVDDIDAVEMKPNICGIGINFNYIFKRILLFFKSKRNGH